MALNLPQRELRNDSGRIIDALGEGADLVLSSGAAPVEQLMALQPDHFVSAAEALRIFRGAPRIDSQRFRADLDAVANQSAHPHD